MKTALKNILIAIHALLDKKADGSHTHDNATASAAGFMSAADKTKLDSVEAGANAYVLPQATSSTLGGVKVRVADENDFYTNEVCYKPGYNGLYASSNVWYGSLSGASDHRNTPVLIFTGAGTADANGMTFPAFAWCDLVHNSHGIFPFYAVDAAGNMFQVQVGNSVSVNTLA